MANDLHDEGTNRTGIARHPLAGPQAESASSDAAPAGGGDGAYAAAMRAPRLEQRVALGSMPPPASVIGALKAGTQVAAGRHPNVLLDKLGERLAFERAGARLYELALHATQVLGEVPGGPRVEELRALRDAEARHAALVGQAIVDLGGDPTCLTPSGDAIGTAGAGLLQVLADPRTSRSQRLCALLAAELTDHDGWELLVDLTRASGHAELAKRFEDAMHEEARHVLQVRGWLRGHTMASLQTHRAGVDT